MANEPETYLGRVTFALGKILDEVRPSKREAAVQAAALVVAWINEVVDLLRGLKQGHRSLGGAGWWVDTGLDQRIDALIPPAKEGGSEK